MIPEAQAPPVGDYGHGDLINAVYHAIRRHPNPVQMAAYGKILASLLADQAKLHAGGHAASGAQHAVSRTMMPTGSGGIGGPQDVSSDYGEGTGIIVPPHRYLGPPVGPMDDPIANAIARHDYGMPPRSAMPLLPPPPGLHGIAGRLPTVGY